MSLDGLLIQGAIYDVSNQQYARSIARERVAVELLRISQHLHKVQDFLNQTPNPTLDDLRIAKQSIEDAKNFIFNYRYVIY